MNEDKILCELESLKNDFYNIQSELELLKNDFYNIQSELQKRQWVKIKDNGEIEPLFYVSKDKIKEKMKIIENECKTCKYNHLLCEERKPLSDNIKYCLKLECYDVLKSLLEEN